VSFSDNAKDPIKISYESTCKIASEAGDLISTQSCEKIEEGEEYQFNLTIKFDKCPEDPNKWVLNYNINGQLVPMLKYFLFFRIKR
jgi:hypothetical protein